MTAVPGKIPMLPVTAVPTTPVLVTAAPARIAYGSARPRSMGSLPKVGREVAVKLGMAEGEKLGIADGEVVGTVLGLLVASTEGLALGTAEGATEGVALGFTLGWLDGLREG